VAPSCRFWRCSPLYGGAETGSLENVSQTIELPRTEGPESGLGGQWRVIVRNDDHNTFDHVAHTLARYVPGLTVAAGYGIADRIHNSGQAIVWSGYKEPAELYWEQLKDAGLTMAPLEQG
jgi:ATP-dependent Clp protease adaptor protein ClpS